MNISTPAVSEQARRFQAICQIAARPVLGISRYLLNERLFNGVDVVEGVALMGLVCREFVGDWRAGAGATGRELTVASGATESTAAE